ncbi:retinaldehyde-binding protein 1-like [Armigeres subalbatus]|uniref:retinaldehyde-binding protein 1-like n=1 Tax=Armigeres subalbatus TaxID=124917 RepID=UPI002ED37E54
MMSADQYNCQLSDQFRTLAKDELREDDNVRHQAMNQLKEWIEKNPHIKKCRTDATFLLKFLRYRKFVVHQAGEAIERYLVARQKFPQWFHKLDPQDPSMQAILSDAPLTALGRDENGRTIILIRISRYDTEVNTSSTILRFIMMMLEIMSEEEEFQIGGVRVWEDHTDMTMKFLGIFNIADFNPMMAMLTKTMPLRIREIHGVNLPKFAVTLANLALSFVSSKVRDRILCHASVLEAKRHLQESLWPQEYGGPIDVDACNRLMMKHLEEKREFLLSLDEMEIDLEHYSDLCSNYSTGSSGEIDTGMIGTFRKLNVD